MLLNRSIHLEDEQGRLSALHRYEVLDTAPESEFDNIIHLVTSIFKVPMAAITLIDGTRQWFKATEGLSVTETPRSIAFCDRTIRSGDVLAVEDARRDHRFSGSEFVTGEVGLQCYLGAPLTTPDGYNIGSICVIGTEPRRFSSADHELLKSFARLVVSQMELRLIARLDSLTGALSRRGFDDAVLQSFTSFQKEGTPACVAIVDLDKFKLINDTHGHPVGDKVLRNVVLAAAQGLRRTDVIGRLGGEEFGILMRGAQIADAWSIAERIRTAIEALRFDDPPELSVTASIGLASCKQDYSHPDMWYAIADSALYKAKLRGRNQTVSRG
jgi:diguanylate cyclase (GGDEF)-like protein